MFAPASEVMESALLELEAIAKGGEREEWYLETGLQPLDELLTDETPGIWTGDVLEVRGERRSGRTALLGQIVRATALRRSAGAVLVTPRARQVDTVLRLLLSEARVDVSLARTGKLGPEESKRVETAAARLWNAPLWFSCGPTSWAQVERDCTALQAKHGTLRALFVDDLPEVGGADIEAVREMARRLGLVAVVVTGAEVASGVRADVSIELSAEAEAVEVRVNRVEGGERRLLLGFDRATGGFVPLPDRSRTDRTRS